MEPYGLALAWWIECVDRTKNPGGILKKELEANQNEAAAEEVPEDFVVCPAKGMTGVCE